MKEKKIYNAGNEALDLLLKSLKEQDLEIKRINSEAAAALDYATVAGLAKGYSDKTRSLNNELDKSYKSVKHSLRLLFLSTLLPVIYMIILSTDMGTRTFSIEEFINQFNIANAIILSLFIAPSAWFAKFSITKYGNIFRLREHYDHKYSTTFAFDGFSSKIDEKNRDGITQLTFMNLARANPATTLPRPKKDNCDDNPLSFWDKAINKLLEAFGLEK